MNFIAVNQAPGRAGQSGPLAAATPQSELLQIARDVAALAGSDPARAANFLNDALATASPPAGAQFTSAVASQMADHALGELAQSFDGRDLLDLLGQRLSHARAGSDEQVQGDRIRDALQAMTHAPTAGADAGGKSLLQQMGLQALVQQARAQPVQLRAQASAVSAAGANGKAGNTEDVKSLFKEQFAAKAADKEGFHAFMKQVYGDKYDANLAEQFRQQALAGDFSWLPDVKLVDSNTLGGANGAYNEKEGVVYINRDIAARDPQLAAQTFVEEAGHHLDAKLNTGDTRGDEGEMFRRVLGGEQLSRQQVAEIRNENDKGSITVDGKQVEVEFWNPFKAIAKAAESVGEAVVDGAKAVGNAVVDGAKAVGRGIEQVGGGAVDGIKSVGEGLLGAVKNVGIGAFEIFGGFAINLFQGNIGEAFSSVVRGFDRAVFQSAQRVVSGVWGGIKSVADGFTDMLGPVGKPIRWVTDRLYDIGGTAIDTAFGMARDAFRMIPDTFTGFVSDVERAVKLAADGKWGDAAEQFGKAFVNIPVRLGGTMVDMGARLLQGVASAGQTAVGAEKPARGLNDEEREYLKRIYGDSVDYDMVRVKEGGPLTDEMKPHTVGNTVYMPSKYFSNGKLTPEGLDTLGHEVGHVWQNQNGGGDYIHGALGAQVWAGITEGNWKEAYDWRQALRDGKTFESMNQEERAKVMEEIGEALANDGYIKSEDGNQGGKAAYNDAELAFLLDTAGKIRFGQGAG